MCNCVVLEVYVAACSFEEFTCSWRVCSCRVYNFTVNIQ